MALIPQGVVIEIAVLAIAYSLLTLQVQRFIIKPSAMKEMQAKMKALSNEMNRLAKEGKDISEKQKELMPLLSQSMNMQLKSMFFVLPVFFVVYYWALPTLFGSFGSGTIMFIVPFNYTGFFIAVAVAFGIIFGIGRTLYGKLRPSAATPAAPS